MNFDPKYKLDFQIHGTYISNQKFDSIKISVFCDIKKILRKIEYVKDVTNIYFE